MPFIYLKIPFTADICLVVRFSIYLLRYLTENMRSSLVQVKYLRLPIKLQYVVGFTLGCDSFPNLHRLSRGVCAGLHSNMPLCSKILNA